MEEYVNSVHTVKKKKLKKKKNKGMCFLREVFTAVGLNSSLSSSTSEQVCTKEGGGGGNRVDSDG